MIKLLLLLMLTSPISVAWSSQTPHEHEAQHSPPLSTCIHHDEPLSLTYSSFLATRQTDEGSSSSHSHEGKHKNKRSLITVEDHQEFLKEAITEKATKMIILSSCEVSLNFLKNYFIPWIASIKTPSLSLRLYTSNKGYELFEQVMSQLKEAVTTRRPHMPKDNRITQPLEDVARQYHRTVKAMNLSLIVHPSLYCKSNILIVDKEVFVSTPLSWLSLKDTKQELLPPIPKDSIYYAPILTGKHAKRQGKHFLKSLGRIIGKESELRKDYSTYLRGILGDDLEEPSVSSTKPEQT
ncbi:MAG: hypothetical protein IBJ00_04175 [Alphaproteobacteria bacterium]|nr:hypothetical protein [Alphaproteobacteria bacterium]